MANSTQHKKHNTAARYVCHTMPSRVIQCRVVDLTEYGRVLLERRDSLLEVRFFFGAGSQCLVACVVQRLAYEDVL